MAALAQGARLPVVKNALGNSTRSILFRDVRLGRTGGRFRKGTGCESLLQSGMNSSIRLSSAAWTSWKAHKGRRFHTSHIVASSPAEEEAAAEAAARENPLSKEDLVDFLRSGCKPKSDWRSATVYCN